MLYHTYTTFLKSRQKMNCFVAFAKCRWERITVKRGSAKWKTTRQGNSNHQKIWTSFKRRKQEDGLTLFCRDFYPVIEFWSFLRYLLSKYILEKNSKKISNFWKCSTLKFPPAKNDIKIFLSQTIFFRNLKTWSKVLSQSVLTKNFYV